MNNGEKSSYVIGIGGKYKYYKLLGKDGKYYFGKTTRPTIPNGAYPVSLDEFIEATVGRALDKASKQELKKINSTNSGSIIVQGSTRRVEGLPNPNEDPDKFKELINQGKI